MCGGRDEEPAVREVGKVGSRRERSGAEEAGGGLCEMGGVMM